MPHCVLLALPEGASSPVAGKATIQGSSHAKSFCNESYCNTNLGKAESATASLNRLCTFRKSIRILKEEVGGGVEAPK
jgi:hypothetical protein